MTFPFRLLPPLYSERQNVSAMGQAVNRHASTCGTDGGQSGVPTGPTPSATDFSLSRSYHQRSTFIRYIIFKTDSVVTDDTCKLKGKGLLRRAEKLYYEWRHSSTHS